MKETKVYTWCDNHQDDKLEAALTRGIALDGGMVRTLDLCEQCNKTLLTPLKELLDARGAIPGVVEPPRKHVRQERVIDPDQLPLIERPAPSKTQQPCQLCGTALTRNGLIGHIYALHVNAAHTRPTPPTACPDCGYESSVQGVGYHRTRIHGYNPLAVAYQAAADHPR